MSSVGLTRKDRKVTVFDANFLTKNFENESILDHKQGGKYEFYLGEEGCILMNFYPNREQLRELKKLGYEPLAIMSGN